MPWENARKWKKKSTIKVRDQMWSRSLASEPRRWGEQIWNDRALIFRLGTWCWEQRMAWRLKLGSQDQNSGFSGGRARTKCVEKKERSINQWGKAEWRGDDGHTTLIWKTKCSPCVSPPTLSASVKPSAAEQTLFLFAEKKDWKQIDQNVYSDFRLTGGLWVILIFFFMPFYVFKFLSWQRTNLRISGWRKSAF